MTRRYRRKASEATRYKQSLSHQGSRNGMYGRHHTQHSKNQISRSMREYWKWVHEYFNDYDEK